MPPKWHPPEENLALLKGSEPYGAQDEGQSEEGQASFHEHGKENEAYQRKAEKR